MSDFPPSWDWGTVFFLADPSPKALMCCPWCPPNCLGLCTKTDTWELQTDSQHLLEPSWSQVIWLKSGWRWVYIVSGLLKFQHLFETPLSFSWSEGSPSKRQAEPRQVQHGWVSCCRKLEHRNRRWCPGSLLKVRDTGIIPKHFMKNRTQCMEAK